MKPIACMLEFDERTNVVTIRHARTRTVQMVIKLELGCEGTMKRVTPDEDCDNFWIGIKPADSVVFEDRLFGPKKLNVKSITFDLI